VVVDVICSDWSQIGPDRARVAPVLEVSAVPVADPAAPVLAEDELGAVAPVPMPTALPPTLAHPATMRTTAAAHHGQDIRRAIAITVFCTSSDNQ
jgi:hypothetical protein